MSLYIEVAAMDDIGAVTSGLRAMNVKIFNVDIIKTGVASSLVGAVFSIYLPTREKHEDAMISISALPSVLTISEV